MKNKVNTSHRNDIIRTKHVFMKDEQVFVKKETAKAVITDIDTAEWFPTDFNWVSAVI